MKWENLQTDCCPHCDAPLHKPEDPEEEITCTRCRFHIARRRFDSIVENRRHPDNGPIVKMKWQALHTESCPICQKALRESEGKFAVMRCVDASCSFRIRVDLMAQILADPEHPANRFKNRT